MPFPRSLLFLFVITIGFAAVGYCQSTTPRYLHDVRLQAGEGRDSILNKAAHVVPNEPQRLYHQDEFSAFIHFGPNTFSGVEWGSGKEDPAIFDPGETLDTDQWCRILKSAGMRKVIITVKHHDGFCIWQTRYNDAFSVKSIPWREGKGDVLRELADSCKKFGLKLGIYLSPADLYQIESPQGLYGNGSPYRESVIPTERASFHSEPTTVRVDQRAESPTFTVQADDYNRYFMNQLYEVLTQYGPIHEVWFDGAHPKRKGDQKYIKPQWYDMVRRLAPEAAIFGGPDLRWCGNEAGKTRDSEWSVLPVESYAVCGEDRPESDLGSATAVAAQSYQVYDKTYQSDYLYYLVAEVNTSIRDGWFWRNDDEQSVRTAEDVFDIYERAVGGNAGFLLNVPPNQNGLISPREEACLVAVGKRIRTTYEPDMLAGAVVTGDATATQDAHHAHDGDLSTSWQPKTTPAELVVTLDQPQRVDRFVLREAIVNVGQRIETHALDVWIDNGWKTIANATTVGNKRILRFSPVTTDRFRVRILTSRGPATIAEVSAHRAAP